MSANREKIVFLQTRNLFTFKKIIKNISWHPFLVMDDITFAKLHHFRDAK